MARLSVQQASPDVFIDDRGTTSIEYLLFFTGVTLLVVASLAVLGPGLLALYRLKIAWLSLPLP